MEKLELIKGAREIKKNHDSLRNSLNRISLPGPRPLRYSTRGKHDGLPVRIFEYAGNKFWFHNAVNPDGGKYFNICGINPDFDSENRILVQINYKCEWEDFHDAAIWAKDDSGNVFLLHSGKMGGGARGITIEKVKSLFGGRVVSVLENGREKEFFLVCQINSERPFFEFASFLLEINKIKSIIKSQENDEKERAESRKLKVKKSEFSIPDQYTPEFWGRRKSYENKGKTEAYCNHGEVVDALRIEIERNSTYGFQCVNNQFIDLGIVRFGKPLALFEIKTSADTQSIYTAIGQVLLHSCKAKSKPLRFIVFPDNLEVEIEADIQYLGISLIRYQWQKGKIVFFSLEKTLFSLLEQSKKRAENSALLRFDYCCLFLRPKAFSFISLRSA